MPERLVLAYMMNIAIYMCSCEIYTSIEHMQRAARASKNMALVIEQYVETQRSNLDQLHRLALDMKAYSDKALNNPKYRLSNPLNAFLFTKKVVLDWSKGVDALPKNTITDSDILHELQWLQEMLPDWEDLEGVVTGLMRLQDTYRLDPTNLVQGRLLTTTSQAFTVDDCFELARQCYESKDYLHAAIWFQQTLRNLNKDSVHNHEKTATRHDVLRYYAHAEYMNGNTSIALPLIDELLSLQAYNEHTEFATNLREDIVNNVWPVSNTTYGPLTEEDIETDEFFNELSRDYEALCRGEGNPASLGPRKQRELVCRYVKGEPQVTLSRFKMEEVYREPWVVMYHDVISDQDIRALKDEIIPMLNRALVADDNETDGTTAPYRISKSAWMADEDNEIVEKLNRRVSSLTGLSIETAEQLQFNNYGTGGYYMTHHDHADEFDSVSAFTDDVGNRIATFMFYLSNVVGGATVFPLLGLSVSPKKGSAVFWYNLERSGDGIWETLHAGCPVLVGTKWVANKWFHERGQEFTRPCSLSETD